MRMIDRQELEALFSLAPLGDILKARYFFENLASQDKAIHEGSPMWAKALSSPSPFSIDTHAVVPYPWLGGNKSAPARSMAVEAKLGVFIVFTSLDPSGPSPTVHMHHIHLGAPERSAKPTILPMGDAPQDICERILALGMAQSLMEHATLHSTIDIPPLSPKPRRGL
jgi:hypothetical protein